MVISNDDLERIRNNYSSYCSSKAIEKHLEDCAEDIKRLSEPYYGLDFLSYVPDADRFEAKYGFKDSLRQYLAQQPLKPAEPSIKIILEQKPAPPEQALTENKAAEDTLMFDNDTQKNKNKLLKIKENAEILLEECEDALKNESDSKVYFKTINKFIEKLETLNNKGGFLPEKLSGELLKAMDSTIVKIFSKKEIVCFVEAFFIKCGLKKVVLPYGEKLSDDDYDYIGNNFMKKIAEKPSQRNTILEKVHDAYEFMYYDSDDEEAYKRIIAGGYTIGC